MWLRQLDVEELAHRYIPEPREVVKLDEKLLILD
jgi:hypothetical protein